MDIDKADLHLLLSNAVETMVDRVLGTIHQNGDLLKQPLSIAEIILSMESSIRSRAEPRQTVLRVGPLELLKYMMQRSDQVLTRARLIKDVWHYKFVPDTNLVDVYVGRLRRKVDGPNDSRMIRSVRGEGFVLSATA
jgi:DNA-binding response OmpR family regulator